MIKNDEMAMIKKLVEKFQDSFIEFAEENFLEKIDNKSIDITIAGTLSFCAVQIYRTCGAIIEKEEKIQFINIIIKNFNESMEKIKDGILNS